MKKKILILLVIGIFIFSGCSFPVDNESGNLTNDTTNTGVKDNTTDEMQGKTTTDDSKVDEDNSTEKKLESTTIPITLYYQDKDGYIIPVTRRIAKQEGIARATVNAIIDSSVNREDTEYYGIFPVLPMGTKILGISMKEGIATIDFNDKLLSYTEEIAERNIISSIVYTLTEFKTINGVRILINGYNKGSLKFNTDISGVLNRENTLINAKKVNLKDGLGKLDIYLFRNSNETYSYILPVSVEISQTENADIPGKIISLLGSKHDDELYSEMPQGVKLLKSSIKGDILTLDFTGDIIAYGGTAREDGILKQVLYSMKQVKGVSKIIILFEGKKVSLPEGTDISKGISLPNEINNVIE